MRVCAIENCDRKHMGRGYCQRHLVQLKRTGSPFPAPKVAKGCGLEGCGERHHANGFCSVHNARRHRTGDPLAVHRSETVEAFWRRVDKTASDGHWLWVGEELGNGYGRISTRKKPTDSGTTLAHRAAWELLIGPIPDGLVIDHVCRVKLCVRPHPDHLEPVTQLENVRRGLHGELRTHCGYGHELTFENTRVDADGGRRCRTCARRWWTDARARKRASVRAMYGVETGVGR